MKLSTFFAVFCASVVLYALLYLKKILNHTEHKPKITYEYTKRNSIMSQAENEFFDMLNIAVGSDYLVFPQLHLSALLDHKIVGQGWKGAFGHINLKSVDYVICSKASRSPIVAIELDDDSHSREDRMRRDKEVDRMFSAAKIPLLRMVQYRNLTPPELEKLIADAIAAPNDI